MFCFSIKAATRTFFVDSGCHVDKDLELESILNLIFLFETKLFAAGMR